MPNLLSVGSIGIDSVSTPFGRANKVVGGSGSYSAIAASFFVPTALVSMVGKDFSKKHMEVFEKQGIANTHCAIESNALRAFKDGATFGLFCR